MLKWISKEGFSFLSSYVVINLHYNGPDSFC